MRDPRDRKEIAKTVQLNHTIIPAKDKKESATFLSEILGLPDPFPFGPFMAVQVDSLARGRQIRGRSGPRRCH